MNIKYVALALSFCCANIFAEITIKPYTGIGYAIVYDDLKKVEQLIISEEATVNDAVYYPNNNRRYDLSTTPLMLAVEKNKPEIVKFLLEQGADTSRENSQHMTAYAIAVENNNQKIKQLFASHRVGKSISKTAQKGGARFTHK